MFLLFQSFKRKITRVTLDFAMDGSTGVSKEVFFLNPFMRKR